MSFFSDRRHQLYLIQFGKSVSSAKHSFVTTTFQTYFFVFRDFFLAFFICFLLSFLLGLRQSSSCERENIEESLLRWDERISSSRLLRHKSLWTWKSPLIKVDYWSSDFNVTRFNSTISSFSFNIALFSSTNTWFTTWISHAF